MTDDADSGVVISRKRLEYLQHMEAIAEALTERGSLFFTLQMPDGTIELFVWRGDQPELVPYKMISTVLGWPQTKIDQWVDMERALRSEDF